MTKMLGFLVTGALLFGGGSAAVAAETKTFRGKMCERIFVDIATGAGKYKYNSIQFTGTDPLTCSVSE